MAMNEAQQVWAAILPLIGGVVSIWFSLRVLVKVLSSAYFRSRVYQRLMAACSFNIILQSVGIIWGPFAVPADTSGFPFARGTPATCSARGFLDQLSIITPMYFLTMYILACIAVKNKSQIKLQPCTEIGIQLLFYGYSVGSSAYLLTLDAFNPIVRSCGLSSIPLGCGGNSDTKEVCERGPQDIAKLQWYFVGLPVLVTAVLPTLLMLLMYCLVRGEEVVKSVCKQSALFFLAGIYWTYSFSALDYGLLIANGGEISPRMNIVANTIRSLQGVWVYMTYIYFRSKNPSCTPPQVVEESAPQQAVQEGKQRSRNSVGGRLSSTFNQIGRTSLAAVSPLKMTKPSFSIFDGENVGDSESPWAKFLVDIGEDESYQEGYEYEDTDYGVQEKRPPKDSETSV